MAQRSQDLHAPGSPILVTNQMGVPDVSGPTPIWNTGSSMADPLLTVRAFDDQVFSAAGRGRWELGEPGRFPRGSRVAGTRGSIDATFVVGANGTARAVLSLVDALVPTRALTLAVDVSNRPLVFVTDAGGVVVARGVPAGSALSPGARAHVRWAWDSTALVGATRHMRLQVNGADVPNADWNVNPTSPWTAFRPQWLLTLAAINLGTAYAEFNGTVESIQISNAVHPL